MVDTPPPTSPAEALLERTRSGVLNVLVAVGLGIAVSGWLLGRRAGVGLVLAPDEARQWAYGGLLGLVAASYLTLRLLGSPSRLRDPARCASRFYRAHLMSAAVGALAVPLGFAYAWTIAPRLATVAPFWIVALAAGAMAYPRRYELDDLPRAGPLPR